MKNGKSGLILKKQRMKQKLKTNIFFNSIQKVTI
jgi:hypothetical protein